MAASSPIPVRLKPSDHRTYSALAASCGETFSTFTRRALAERAVRQLASNLDPETAEKVRQILEEEPTP
jgi:hypothetical protein